MKIEELCTRAGGSYEELLQRIPSQAMICRFVRKYADDPTYQQLCSAVAAQDWETAFRAAHTMKGVAQNLGFQNLYLSSVALTEAMRGPKPLTQPELLDAVTADQKVLMDAIGQLED